MYILSQDKRLMVSTDRIEMVWADELASFSSRLDEIPEGDTQEKVYTTGYPVWCTLENDEDGYLLGIYPSQEKALDAVEDLATELNNPIGNLYVMLGCDE